MVQRILVATDGSNGADAAVAKAATICADIGAELVILTVIPRPPVALHIEPTRNLPVIQVYTAREAQTVARDAARDASKLGAEVTVRVERGDPAGRIVHVAEGSLCDLIVLGAKGAGVTDALLGSVVREVIAETCLAVLIVKSEQDRHAWFWRHRKQSGTPRRIEHGASC